MEKVAVVTGSAKGLGRAIAIALAQKRFTLAVHYRKSKEEATKVLATVRKSSPKSIMVFGDLTDEDQVKTCFSKIFKEFGKVDLLVNNVGNFIYKKFLQTTNEEFGDIIESNIYTTLFATRAVLPMMRKQKSGQIINIGAVGAERIQILENSTPYFLAKAGLYVLTKIMANEEASHGIRINMISPGSLATDIFKPSDFPMGRSASYQDVINVIKFLISEDAYYINGANIEVAGGFIPGLNQSQRKVKV